MLSEKYKAMFTGGLKESQGNQVIVVDHISYEVFEQIMNYLYTGDFSLDEKNTTTDQIVDILRVADEEFLDDVSFYTRKLIPSRLKCCASSAWLSFAK